MSIPHLNCCLKTLQMLSSTVRMHQFGHVTFCRRHSICLLVRCLVWLFVCWFVFSWLAGLLGLLVCPFVCLCSRAYVFNVHVSANIQVIKGLLKLSKAP